MRLDVRREQRVHAVPRVQPGEEIEVGEGLRFGGTFVGVIDQEKYPETDGVVSVATLSDAPSTT